jgi:hypothetical protein
LKHFKKHDKKGTYCFPWAEETIGDDLGACGGNSESKSLILLDLLVRSHGVSVNVLEHLVESEFTESLERVTNPGWEETLYRNHGENSKNKILTHENPLIPSAA